MTVFPSKNLSALWPGKKNWKKLGSMRTVLRFVTLRGSRSAMLSGNVNSPSRISAKNPTHSCV
jgi:hypothetical protein